MAKTERRQKTMRLPKPIEAAVKAAGDKKAEDIVVLDLKKASGFTDYFVICSGNNARQIHAIAEAIIDAVGAHGSKPAHVEGHHRSEWVLVDYFDFVVHVFTPEMRMFYGLERLWGNAEPVTVATS